jgi:hypothetical protein
MGLHLLPDRQTAQPHRNFLETSPVATWRCASSCEAEVVVSAWQRSSTLCEDVWQWLNTTYTGKWTGLDMDGRLHGLIGHQI